MAGSSWSSFPDTAENKPYFSRQNPSFRCLHASERPSELQTSSFALRFPRRSATRDLSRVKLRRADEIRRHWQRQWAELDSHLELRGFNWDAPVASVSPCIKSCAI